MGQKEFEAIKNFLNSNKVNYKLFEHKQVKTSEEAASVRNVPLSQGMKSLILIAKEKGFVLCLVPGNRKIELKALRKILDAKDIRLADHEDVLRITGCEIGSVHPFGNLFKEKLEIYIDKNVLDNKRVDFSVGTFVNSIEMELKDFLKLVKVKIEEFTIYKNWYFNRYKKLLNLLFAFIDMPRSRNLVSHRIFVKKFREEAWNAWLKAWPFGHPGSNPGRGEYFFLYDVFYF